MHTNEARVFNIYICHQWWGGTVGVGENQRVVGGVVPVA